MLLNEIVFTKAARIVAVEKIISFTIDFFCKIYKSVLFKLGNNIFASIFFLIKESA